MDDTKVITKIFKNPKSFIQTMKIFNPDSGIELGTEKSGMLIMKSGKRKSAEGTVLQNKENLRMLG